MSEYQALVIPVQRAYGNVGYYASLSHNGRATGQVTPIFDRSDTAIAAARVLVSDHQEQITGAFVIDL